MNIKIILGSTREGRFSDSAGEWVLSELQQREGVSAEVIDLRDYDLPFFNESVSPSMKTEPYTQPEVVRFTQKIAEGDAFIMVTPEYNHSTSGVLKNAIDWVGPEWNNKPVGFVSYGSVGGARAIEQLRLIMIELQMAPIQKAVMMLGNDYFPVVFGGASRDELFATYQKHLEGMLDQLLWWGKALTSAR